MDEYDSAEEDEVCTDPNCEVDHAHADGAEAGSVNHEHAHAEASHEHAHAEGACDQALG